MSDMKEFIKEVWAQYIVPQDCSVYSQVVDADGTIVEAVYDLEALIQSCVRDLRSQLLVTGYHHVLNQQSFMPEDTVTVLSARYDYPVPGNNNVKFSYEKGNRQLRILYTPAYITFRRKLRVEDLPSLEGDRAIFFKSYLYWKMATQELHYMTMVGIHTDNASVDTKAIEEFASDSEETYKNLIPEILMYGAKF